MEIGESCAISPPKNPSVPKVFGNFLLDSMHFGPSKNAPAASFLSHPSEIFPKISSSVNPLKSKQKKPCPADALHIRRAGPSIVFYSFPCEMLHQRFPDYKILNAHGPRADFVFIEARLHCRPYRCRTSGRRKSPGSLRPAFPASAQSTATSPDLPPYAGRSYL